MPEVLTNKDNFLKFGFCVVRNLFDDKEIEKYRRGINEICKKKVREMPWTFIIIGIFGIIL